MAKKEKSLQTAILSYLEGLPECVPYNLHGSAYTESGRPDVVACYRGWFLAIEVKRPGQEPTKIQRYHLQRLKKAGAITFVAERLADVKKLIQTIDETMNGGDNHG